MAEMIILSIVLVIVFIMIVILLSVRNLKSMREEIKCNYRELDKNLKERWDSIPRFIQCFKDYFDDEKDIIEPILRLRNTTYSNMSASKKLKTNDSLDDKLMNLLSLKDKYSSLIGENFEELYETFVILNEQINHFRRKYYAAIEKYNNKIKRFPINVIAKIFKFKKIDIYD